MTRAAARLHLTQPPLTVQLSRLERELGVPLLIRHRRGVDLTDAGRYLATHARRLLAEVDALAGSVRQLGRGAAGGLRSRSTRRPLGRYCRNSWNASGSIVPMWCSTSARRLQTACWRQFACAAPTLGWCTCRRRRSRGPGTRSWTSQLCRSRWLRCCRRRSPRSTASGPTSRRCPHSNFWPRHPAHGAGCNGTSSRRVGRPIRAEHARCQTRPHGGGVGQCRPRGLDPAVIGASRPRRQGRCAAACPARAGAKPQSFGVAMNRPRRQQGICCGLPFPPRSRTCLPPSSPPPAPNGTTRCGGGASRRLATSGRQQR